MMKMLKKLMEEKGQSEMDPAAKKAKESVLKEISDMAGKSMGEDVKGLKKVSVMSDSPEGLKAGLEKAEEVVEEAEESDDMESMSDEEIEMLMKKLEELKAKKKA
jgi:rRNA maturation endonuclease Nob1